MINRQSCIPLQVGVQTSQTQLLHTNSELHSWEIFNEDISSVAGDTTITVIGLLDQLNITRDSSDYLWYTTRLDKTTKMFYTQHIFEIVSPIIKINLPIT